MQFDLFLKPRTIRGPFVHHALWGVPKHFFTIFRVLLKILSVEPLALISRGPSTWAVELKHWDPKAWDANRDLNGVDPRRWTLDFDF